MTGRFHREPADSPARSGLPARALVLTGVLATLLIAGMAAATEALARDVLVRFEPGTTAAERAEARDEAGATFEASLPLRGLQLVSPDPGETAAVVAAGLERSSEVMYAEPDASRTAFAFPNDTFAGDLWGMRNTGQNISGAPGTVDADIDADEAWDVTTGDPAVGVGIIDSGVALTHPDLASNIRLNPGESGALSSNGIDDDLNGYVDDWRGWDWVADDNDPSNGDFHGTHVAGTVGARANDGAGVMGVAWEVGLTSLRVLGASGTGNVSDLIAAYGYARTRGLEVVNASLGGGSPSLAERDAIAAASDTLFVVAAGNAGGDNDVTHVYPCDYDVANVICVAATDQDDALASFSNYSDVSVDLAAPGVFIRSTMPGPNWAYASGTSMATPHVAGAAALVWSKFPAASVAGVRAALLESVDEKPALSGKTATGGRLNAYRALSGIPATPPPTPTPPPATPTPPATPPVTTPPATPRPRLEIRVALRGRLVLRRGVRLRTRCSRACRFSHELRIGSRVVGRVRGRLDRAGAVNLRLKLTAKARRRLRRSGGAVLRLRTRAVDGSGRIRTAGRRVRLYRR